MRITLTEQDIKDMILDKLERGYGIKGSTVTLNTLDSTGVVDIPLSMALCIEAVVELTPQAKENDL